MPSINTSGTWARSNVSRLLRHARIPASRSRILPLPRCASRAARSARLPAGSPESCPLLPHHHSWRQWRLGQPAGAPGRQAGSTTSGRSPARRNMPRELADRPREALTGSRLSSHADPGVLLQAAGGAGPRGDRRSSQTLHRLGPGNLRIGAHQQAGDAVRWC